MLFLKRYTNIKIIIKMKVKNLFVALLAVAAVSSCTSGKPGKTVFNNKVDSVSYAIGMARSNGFLPYLYSQMNVDSAYFNDFLRGFYEGASKSDDKALIAYMAGLQIGQSEVGNMCVNISSQLFGEDSNLSMNVSNYLNGFIDGTNEDTKIMDRAEAENVADRLFEEIRSENMELQYGALRDAGVEFLANKAKEDGVVATGSGLLYKVIKQGKGKKPASNSQVKVKYKGSLIDGTVFDESSEPITLSVGGVIAGWTEALQLMNEGSKWELYIPYELGYGERGAGEKIKPFSALVFEVELVSIL